jgi:LytS/YehU family sensor histidine kinase
MADRLVLTVADTGPGLAGTATSSDPAPASTHVGLANIRERLVQAYGDDHRFELAENSPQGLIVLIDIPYQTDAPHAAIGGDGRKDTQMGAQVSGSLLIQAH